MNVFWAIKQIFITYVVLFIPALVEYITKRLLSVTFNTLFILRWMPIVIYSISGILLAEIIQNGLKVEKNYKIILYFNLIILLIIYKFVPAFSLNIPIVLYTNMLLIGCYLYMILYLLYKQKIKRI